MSKKKSMSEILDERVIPFYGGAQPRLFEIERRCMDRDGKVIAYLHEQLPAGLVLDVGAGNGFTAVRLTTSTRTVVALEPDPAMVDPGAPLVWARGVAQDIPFHDALFDAAYATWAFFFRGRADIEEGLSEIRRVVKPGGKIIIVDNAGDDELSAFSPREIAGDPDWWQARDFQTTIIDTAFKFSSLAEANELLEFYFGEDAVRENRKTEITFKVAVYQTTRGNGAPADL